MLAGRKPTEEFKWTGFIDVFADDFWIAIFVTIIALTPCLALALMFRVSNLVTETLALVFFLVKI